MNELSFLLTGVILGLLLANIFPPVTIKQEKVKFKRNSGTQENTLEVKRGLLKRIFSKRKRI
jgi:hypothetical protein